MELICCGVIKWGKKKGRWVEGSYYHRGRGGGGRDKKRGGLVSSPRGMMDDSGVSLSLSLSLSLLVSFYRVFVQFAAVTEQHALSKCMCVSVCCNQAAYPLNIMR